MSRTSVKFSVYRLTTLALLIACLQTSRFLFSFLPNVQPVTVLLILITLTFGLIDGLIVAAGTMLVSNLVLGMGPWTFAQIGAYAVIVLLTYIADHLMIGKTVRYLFWLLFSGCTGLLYGLLISILQAPILGLSFSGLIGYWIAGLWFDGYHAAGNIGFFIILYPTVTPIFQKVSDKLNSSKQRNH